MYILCTSCMQQSVRVTDCKPWFGSFLLLLGILFFTVVNPVHSATCTGDTPGNIKDGKTCAQLVTESTKSECYNSTTEMLCCSSCDAVATNVPGCNYGDYATCHVFFCEGLTNKSVCCETCTTTSSSSSATSSTTTATSSTTSTTTTTTTTTTSPTTTTTTTTTTSGTTTTTKSPTPSSTPSSTTSSTTSPTPSSTTSSITSSSTSTTASPNAGASKTSNDDTNEGAIIGGILGGVALAFLILFSIVTGMKLCKRSKQKIEHSEDQLPPKPDLLPTPTRPELYSTPTMVVIDTSPNDPRDTDTISDNARSVNGDIHNRNTDHIPPQKHPVKANAVNDDKAPEHDNNKDTAGNDQSRSVVKQNELQGNEQRLASVDSRVFAKRTLRPLVNTRGLANNLAIEDLNGDDDGETIPGFKESLAKVESDKIRFSYPKYN